MGQAGIQAAYNKYFEEGLEKAKPFAEYLKGIPKTVKGEQLRSILGYLYTNLANIMDIDPSKPKMEQTTTAQISSFVNYGFPMIRTIIPSLAAINLVTVQPLPSPNGYIFYLEYKHASDKGRVRKGTTLFEDLNGINENSGANYDENASYAGYENYSSELVDGFPLTTFQLVGTRSLPANININTSLQYLPVRPRTCRIYLAYPNDASNRLLIAEDVIGNGQLTSLTSANGNLYLTSGTIDYGSGLLQLSLNSSAQVPTSVGTRNVSNTERFTLEVDYKYQSEGSKNIPEIEILLGQSAVTSEPSSLRCRWSVQSQAVLKSQYNLSIQDELAMAIANELRFEIDTRISQRIRKVAYVPQDSELPRFNIVPRDGVSYLLHKEEFMQTLTDAASIIEKRSARGTGTWVICGRKVASLIRNLNDFVPDAFIAGRGIRKIGRLKGMYDIYYDPTYSDVEWVMGYKGDSFLSTGIVYAPYIAFYATPVTTLDDLVSRQAMYTQYALETVNSRFYIRSRIVTSRG